MKNFNLPCPHNDDKECEYCKGITTQDGWRFRGCFFPPNRGKHVVGIKDCPLKAQKEE